MVMIARPPARADTEWYATGPARVRGRHLIEPLRGGPERGDPGVARPYVRYLQDSTTRRRCSNAAQS